MTIVILNKRPLRVTPYEKWLPNCRNDVVLFTAASNQTAPDLARARDLFRQVEVVPDYDTTGLIELKILAMHAVQPITGIVALSEVDLMRAAQLRERLGLPGQNVASATAFRDKFVMKSLAATAGIATPRMRAINSVLDLIEFTEEIGYPVIVKPRTGAATIGVSLLRNVDELQVYLGRGLVGTFAGTVNLLAEEFIPGAMFHVDGVFGGDEMIVSWPHAYMYDMLAVMNEGKPLGGRAVAPDDPLRARLQDFAKAVLAALPNPPGPTAFHLEVFHTPDDRLVLCEVASRAGGNGINDMLREELGIDMCEWATKAQASLERPDRLSTASPTQLAGWLLIPPQMATFVEGPGSCNLPYVTFYQLTGVTDRAYVPAGNSVTHVASFVFVARDEQELAYRQQAVQDWFQSRVQWRVTTGKDA